MVGDVWFWAILVMALGLSVVAGFSGGGNLIAMPVAARAMPAWAAVVITALGMVCGPFILGVAVAHTIGKGLVDVVAAGPRMLVAALLASALTLLLSWWRTIPTSSSAALVGGMLGATWAGPGFRFIRWGGTGKALLSLSLSLGVGALAGIVAFRLLQALLSRLSYRQGRRASSYQYLTTLAAALAYGANDGERVIGVLAAAVMLAVPGRPFVVYPWIILLAGGAWIAGLLCGGWRVATTVGFKIFRLRPIHGLAAQGAAAATVMAGALLGGPVSSTLTADAALIGVGASDRPGQLNWQVARAMVVAWLLTLPLGVLLGAGAELVLKVI